MEAVKYLEYCHRMTVPKVYVCKLTPGAVLESTKVHLDLRPREVLVLTMEVLDPLSDPEPMTDELMVNGDGAIITVDRGTGVDSGTTPAKPLENHEDVSFYWHLEYLFKSFIITECIIKVLHNCAWGIRHLLHRNNCRC